jgi:broad specificity phosphatase PhoE
MLLIRHGQSHFNVAFAVTRIDPGIKDPELTDEGRRQIVAAAAELTILRQQGRELRRLITSPYTRALQTASILAEALGLPVTVDPLVRERAAFMCDVGASPASLRARFPDYRFDHLADPWWHDHIEHGVAETEDVLAERAAAFRHAMAADPDASSVVVVTHWGFIRAMTDGYRSANGEIVPVSLS